jgi:hypothetical protein
MRSQKEIEAGNTTIILLFIKSPMTSHHFRSAEFHPTRRVLDDISWLFCMKGPPPCRIFGGVVEPALAVFPKKPSRQSLPSSRLLPQML